MRILLSLVLTFLFAVNQAHADNTVPYARIAALRTGINLDEVFQGAQPFKPTIEDYKAIKEMGFTNVRFPVGTDYMVAGAPAYNWATAPKAWTDKCFAQALADVDLMLQAGLTVTFALMPINTWDELMQTPDPAVRGRVAPYTKNFWTMAAPLLAKRDPNKVFLEILNEPLLPVAELTQLQNDVIKIIRTTAPNHTILVGPTHYYGLDDLVKMPLVNDKNVVYAFHFYEPFNFTHQGAPFSPTTVNISGVMFPDAKNTSATITARLELAANWSKKNNVPIVMNEFGSFYKADYKSRLAWTKTISDAATSLNIPWALWNYYGLEFGVMYPDKTNKRIIDNNFIRALSRHPLSSTATYGY